MERIPESEWELLVRFLPSGWAEQAHVQGAFGRARRIRSPGDLLRLVLMHVAVGLSLQRVAEVAQAIGLAELSKVSVWERVRKAQRWLQWLVGSMLRMRIECPALGGYRVRVVDGTMVTGPRQRVQVRLHYALELGSFDVSELVITDERTAEGLEHFAVGPDQLLIGDRGYARAKGIEAVKQAGGDVLVRVGQTSVTLYDDQEQPICRLEWLRTLGGYEPGECSARVRGADGEWIQGRLCGLRLSEAQAAKARRRCEKKAQRRGNDLRPATAELAGYLCLFTTAPAERLPLSLALELYRARWQIELAFKRLKSVLHADQLRDTSWHSALCWLLAKMLYALLLYAYLDEAGAFSPWGYPLTPAQSHAASGVGPHATRPRGCTNRHPGPRPLHAAGLATRPSRARRRSPTTHTTPSSRRDSNHALQDPTTLT